MTRLLTFGTVPRSRHNPQFNDDALGPRGAPGIRYEHVAGLGGIRRTPPGSPEWGMAQRLIPRVRRLHADSGVRREPRRTHRRASDECVALMCAEAVPWRCHRSLIADALVVHDVHVEEITSATRCQVHTLTSFARVEGRVLAYPAVSAMGKHCGGQDEQKTDGS